MIALLRDLFIFEKSFRFINRSLSTFVQFDKVNCCSDSETWTCPQQLHSCRNGNTLYHFRRHNSVLGGESSPSPLILRLLPRYLTHVINPPPSHLLFFSRSIAFSP